MGLWRLLGLTLEAFGLPFGGPWALLGLILGGLGSILGHLGRHKVRRKGSRKAPWKQAGEKFSFLYPSSTKT